MRKIVPFVAVALCTALASLVPLSAVPAQGKVPKRPKLEAGADTNHAPTYYRHGLRVLEQRPEEAAAAFYWAARLDPGWAQPLYARRIALLMTNPSFLVRYFTGGRRARQSKEVKSIDSLELRARMIDPFVIRDLDRQFIVGFFTADWELDLRRQGLQVDAVTRQSLSYYIERELGSDASVWLKADLAASERRFPEALDLYRKALGRFKDDVASIHVDRAHVFYLIGSDDSARVALELALDDLRKRDVKEFVRLYESKAVLEHGIGMVHERSNNLEAAREAYGRALQEDLAYYPAHVRLGLVALAAGDTATALSELALAVEIKGDEPGLLTTYGSVLAQMGKFQEADGQLRRAVELEPYYPAPRYLLGRIADLTNKPAEALDHYQAFLARAPGRDARLTEVKSRVSALTTTAGKP